MVVRSSSIIEWQSQKVSSDGLQCMEVSDCFCTDQERYAVNTELMFKSNNKNSDLGHLDECQPEPNGDFITPDRSVIPDSNLNAMATSQFKSNIDSQKNALHIHPTCTLPKHCVGTLKGVHYCYHDGERENKLIASLLLSQSKTNFTVIDKVEIKTCSNHGSCNIENVDEKIICEYFQIRKSIMITSNTSFGILVTNQNFENGHLLSKNVNTTKYAYHYESIPQQLIGSTFNMNSFSISYVFLMRLKIGM